MLQGTSEEHVASLAGHSTESSHAKYKTSRVKNSHESVRRLRCNCEFSIPMAREVGCRRVPAHKRCGNCKQASAQRHRRKQTRMLKLKSLRSRNHQSSSSTWVRPSSRHREARRCPTPARNCARRTPWEPACTPWCTPARNRICNRVSNTAVSAGRPVHEYARPRPEPGDGLTNSPKSMRHVQPVRRQVRCRQIYPGKDKVRHYWLFSAKSDSDRQV